MRKLILVPVILATVAACQSTRSAPTPVSHYPSSQARQNLLNLEHLSLLSENAKSGVKPAAASPNKTSTSSTSRLSRASRTRFPTNAETVTGLSKWYRLADCESGEWLGRGASRGFQKNSARWDDTRGYYEGGLQFDPGTWRAYGGTKYAQHAYQATPMQQITVAIKVLADQGWAAWPVCSRKLHYR